MPYDDVPTLPHARPNVLVVEDGPPPRGSDGAAVGAGGLPVCTAANGAEALGAVARRMPDLILLDLKMPVMDGRAFLDEVRRRYAAPPPVVLLSATIGPVSQADDLDVAGYLGKPFDVEDLLDSVKRYASNRN